MRFIFDNSLVLLLTVIILGVVAVVLIAQNAGERMNREASLSDE